MFVGNFDSYVIPSRNRSRDPRTGIAGSGETKNAISVRTRDLCKTSISAILIGRSRYMDVCIWGRVSVLLVFPCLHPSSRVMYDVRVGRSDGYGQSSCDRLVKRVLIEG